MDGWTGQSQDGTPGSGRGGVLLTDVTAGGAALGGAAGRAQASHLSLPFWMEAWPRLALSRSGEFLLRFVLVERTLFVEGVGVVFFLSRPGRGLAGTLAVLLAFRPDSRSSSGRLFSALLL